MQGIQSRRQNKILKNVGEKLMVDNAKRGLSTTACRWRTDQASPYAIHSQLLKVHRSLLIAQARNIRRRHFASTIYYLQLFTYIYKYLQLKEPVKTTNFHLRQCSHTANTAMFCLQPVTSLCK